VIDRLVTGLRELVDLPAAHLETAAGRRLRGDCADAVRLELDCPQQSLTPSQRSALARLSDALEESGTPTDEILAAARTAYRSLTP
jgi:hypothetical protein